MIRKTVPSNGKKYHYFTCSTNRINKKSCTSHSINEKSFEEAVLKTINIHIKSILDIERILKYIDTLPYKHDEVKKLDRMIVQGKEEIQKLEKYKLSTYESYVDKVLNLNEYKSHIKRYDEKIQKIEEDILKIEKEIGNIAENNLQTNQWIENFKEYQDIDKLTRKIIISLVEKIYIYENGKIDIRFRYKTQYDKTLAFIENNQLIKMSDIKADVKGVM